MTGASGPASSGGSGGADRTAVQDVVFGDLDLIEVEGHHDFDQDHQTGDDRFGTVGVEAGDLFALLQGHRCELREPVLNRG